MLSALAFTSPNYLHMMDAAHAQDIKAALDTAGSMNKSPPSGALDPISAASAQLYHMLPV